MDLSALPPKAGKPVPLFNYKTVKLPKGYIAKIVIEGPTAEAAGYKPKNEGSF
jgi:hypothetical protein